VEPGLIGIREVVALYRELYYIATIPVGKAYSA
jgi:hypothetical protein